MLYNVTGLSDGTENSSAGAPLNSVFYSPNRYLDGDGQRLKEAADENGRPQNGA